MTHSLPHLGQHLEVVDIEGWGVRVEELGFFIVRVRESMRTSSRDRHVVTQLGHYRLPVETVELHLALGDEEGLVVHFVPMRRGTLGVWRKREFGGTNTIVCVLS